VDKELVGGLDRRRRDAVLAGELPESGERLAGGQLTAGDTAAELANDLFANRLRLFWGKVEKQR
jgi:hypothetical protein